MRTLIVILAWLAASAVRAAPPGWEQHPGARLPLDVRLTDNARSVALADYFRHGAVVLVFGYFSCPNLCSANMLGALAAAAGTGLAPTRFSIVMVSIDPAENAQLVERKRVAYRERLAGSGIALNLLTGSEPAIDRLTAAAGFRFARDAQRGLMHPSGFLVASPDGAITHYFPEAHVEPRDLRLALVQALDGQAGNVSDRIALICSHFDPATGRYTGMALALVRASGLFALGGLATVVWVSRKRRRRHA